MGDGGLSRHNNDWDAHHTWDARLSSGEKVIEHMSKHLRKQTALRAYLDASKRLWSKPREERHGERKKCDGGNFNSIGYEA